MTEIKELKFDCGIKQLAKRLSIMAFFHIAEIGVDSMLLILSPSPEYNDWEVLRTGAQSICSMQTK